MLENIYVITLFIKAILNHYILKSVSDKTYFAAQHYYPHNTHDSPIKITIIF